MKIKPIKKTYVYRIEDFTQDLKVALIQSERELGYIWEGSSFYDVSDDVEVEFTLLEHLQKRLNEYQEEIKKRAFLE